MNPHYMTYDSTPSPNLRLLSLDTNRYKVNGLGLTYGSDYWAKTIEEAPDLIRVVGINGKEGYVYRDEFYAGESIKDPAEAVEYEASRAASYSVPVYKEDGITEIDTFIIGETEN